MHEVIFDPNWEIYADYRGIHMLPSGTSPYHPDNVSFVFRNADYRYELTKEEQAAVRNAASVSERKLLAVLHSIFRPVGRAAEGDWL